MDIMKAFDQVPVDRLLIKAKSHGIKGDLLAWISSFLKDRTMTVMINGEKSSEGKVTSGVPQGSVLGPLLFVIFINDMPESISSQLMMFADDTKLFREISHEADHENLQKDLNLLSVWSNQWKLKFHPEKCSTMHIGKTNTEYNYHLNGHLLVKSTVEKDLGVHVDNKLNFEEHMQSKISKARQMWGLIRRSFSYIDCEMFAHLFKSLVRPHLEYGNTIWSPQTKCFIKDIESVQRQATKQVPGLEKLSYPDRLRKLRLPTLNHRRRRGDLIEIFKIIRGHYDPKCIPQFIQYDENSITRGHEYRLKRPMSKTNLGQGRFMSRVISDWNALPEQVVTSSTVNAFKNQLDEYSRISI